MISKKAHLKRLEKERKAICLTPRERLAVERGADEADDAQGSSERYVATYATNSAAAQLRANLWATKRTEAGRHHECENDECGKLIPDKRLLAIPSATLCLKCAAERESSKRTADDWKLEVA